MRTTACSSACLGVLLGFARIPAQAVGSELTIEVHIYDYVGVSDAALARAEQETARIFEHVGVAISWNRCPTRAGGEGASKACRLPDAPFRLTLRLLTDSMARALESDSDIFGSARLPDEGRGVLADIYAERTRQLARGRDFEMILGRAMAHELGHLLLGKNAHSSTGIMHTPWRDRDLEATRQAAMTFSGAEGKRIRSEVRARLATPLETGDQLSSEVRGAACNATDPEVSWRRGHA